MKSIFLKRKQQLNEVIIFIFILFLSFVFESIGWITPAKEFSQKFANQLLLFNTKIVEKSFEPFERFIFTVNKSKYLKELELKYVQSLSQLNELDALKKENEELRKILNVSDRKISDSTIVGAPIVSLAFPAVGVGEADGVKVNDMVLVNQVLIGTIDSVSEYQSRVSLLSSKRKSRILAQTESGIEGVVTGNGKNVLLTHIPRNVEVREGERVMTVGQEGIQKNILIGTVQKIKNDPADATQTFVVSQLVSFYDTVLVEVK